MATPGPLERANRVLSTTLALPVVLLRYAVAEPLLTGSLLFALTRAPEQYRQRLLKLLRDRGISNDAIGKIVRSLKILLAVGVASRLNDGLNRLALNHWHLKKPGEPFKFGDTQKSELIVVTGGCSGFGYEMVKSFSRHARVAILDIAPVPEDLEISTSDCFLYAMVGIRAVKRLKSSVQRHGLEFGLSILDYRRYFYRLHFVNPIFSLDLFSGKPNLPNCISSSRRVLLQSRPYRLCCDRGHRRNNSQRAWPP